jgi:hypothetical protein
MHILLLNREKDLLMIKNEKKMLLTRFSEPGRKELQPYDNR